MPEDRSRIVLIAGSVIALIMQVVLAPNMLIAHAMPNFVLVFCLVYAVAFPHEGGVLLPFVLGLLFDLMNTAPVGAMAFLLTLTTFAATRAFAVLNNDTLFMPLVILIVSILAIEVLYGVFLIWFGADVSVSDALVYRSLPCALYDVIVGLLLYPIVSRLASGPSQQSGMPPYK